MKGELPPELGNLSKLKKLMVTDSNLTGSIPSELGRLSNLGELDLSYNKLTGEIPESFAGLEDLYSLHLHENSGLCAPHSMQEWLERRTYSGPLCPEP